MLRTPAEMQTAEESEERRFWPHDPATFYSYRREREFYKYYEPIRSHTRAPLVNVFDDEAVKAHKPKNRTDSTLTAFCQLGALRLKTRRCMLFFFDTEYAYILAEATQTLSLQDDDVHEEDDALWLGTTIIPRGMSVCEHTVNIPDSNAGSNRSETNFGRIHIINNLKDDTRFCDRPFVDKGPRARFYAGVPIVTPNGFSIGAFCALDDKPRDGLTNGEIDFLNQMSRNVIDHLENIRNAAEYGRGSKMLTSLGTFFKTAPLLGHARYGPNSRAEHRRISKLVHRQGPASSTPDADGSTSQSIQGEQSPAQETMKHEAIEVKDYAQPPEQDVDQSTTRSVASTETASVVKTPEDVEDDLQNTLEDSIASTFETAADLIRTAADVDGVVFLDVNPQLAEARVRRRVPARQQGSSHSRRGSETDGTSTDGSVVTESDETTRGVTHLRSKILGRSTSSGASLAQTTSNFPIRVIKLLLRRYKHGKIWNFNSEGVASLQNSASDATEASDGTELSDVNEEVPSSRESARSKRLNQEMGHIQQLFPGVRALCFVPLWDPVKERVYAVALLASYSPQRVLTNDGELSFMRAFCDVVMASIGRLETSMEEQAKTQFISTISHELRSPLHGILGGIDFLHGQEKPDKTILSQIEGCATTLIEIIEHLLEYAKINNMTKHYNALPGYNAKNADSSAEKSPGIALARLTEEVADATFYSHSWAAPQSKQVTAYIFECDLQPEWRSDISVGAWKRVCMNIINNALKYTPKGYIKVSLKQITKNDEGDAHGAVPLPAAQLSVEDTGIGMSKDFLERGLFRAFKQENSLNPGTGLGMSLVAKLVKSIGGEIEVRSKRNSGTTTTITVPLLKQTADKEQDPPLHGVKVMVQESLASAKPSTKARADKLQMSAIKAHVLALGASIEPTEAACSIIFEHDRNDLSDSAQSAAQTPVIRLCSSGPAAADCASTARDKQSKERAVCITQPFGPAKLLEAIQKCLSHKLEHDAITKANKSSAADTKATTQVVPTRPKTLLQDYASNMGGLMARHAHQGQLPDTRLVQIPAASLPAGVDDSQECRLPLLLVDDNVINLRILTMYAKRQKHPYMTAENGQQAVDAYKSPSIETGSASIKTYPRVIFMDINMPIMSGFEATILIRDFERRKQLQPAVIIALTGLGSKDAQEQATSSGIDLFLTKPVRTAELTKVLDSVAANVAAS